MKNFLIILSLFLAFSATAFESDPSYMSFGNCEYVNADNGKKISITLLFDYLANDELKPTGLFYAKDVETLDSKGHLRKVDQAEKIEIDFTNENNVIVTLADDNFLDLKDSNKLEFGKSKIAKLETDYGTLTCNLYL